MNALTFNKVTLNPVTQNDDQIWLTASDLAAALGYKNIRSLNKVYNSNADEFSDNMTKIIEVTDSVVSLKTKGLTVKTRIFSLRGCHLLAMFSRTDIAKDFRQWVLDVLDNEVGEPVIQSDALSTVKDRNGLVKAVRMAQKRLGLGYDETFNLIHHRFNIARISELTVNQVGAATEFIQHMMLSVITNPYKAPDHNENRAIFGSPTTLIVSRANSSKFIGEIGTDGRITMREMSSDEFLTTLKDLPAVINDVYPIDTNQMAQISVAASQKIAHESYLNAKSIKHEG